MVRLLFYIWSASLLWASCKGQKNLTIPDPQGRVADFAGVFTAAQVSHLDSLVRAHEMKTSNQAAAVTLRSDSATIPSLAAFEKFSLELFNRWGVGQKEKNNGVAIIFSPVLRYVQIEVGRGLESKLTDAEAAGILDMIILPQFKKAAFFEGMIEGLDAIFTEIGD